MHRHNIKGDRASTSKIPLWIFASANLLPPAVSSTLQVFIVLSMKFMTSSDILYILRLFIIQLCGTISYAFLKSIQAIVRFFHLLLLSSRMCWSMYSNSAVPQDPLQHPFYSSGNNLRLDREWKISPLICAVNIFHIIAGKLWVYNCLGSFLCLGPFVSMWSFL